jgi:hypothetical protein
MKAHRAAVGGRITRASDYEQLIVLLKAELSEMYPDLELGGYFRGEA